MSNLNPVTLVGRNMSQFEIAISGETFHSGKGCFSVRLLSRSFVGQKSYGNEGDIQSAPLACR